MSKGDQRFRVQIIRAGVWTTWILSACAAVYIAATWGEHQRPLMLAIVAGAGIEAAVIALLPTARLTAPGVYDRFLVSWQVAHIAVAGLIYHLDGAGASPFLAIFVVSVAFAGGALSRTMVIVVAGLNGIVLTGIWALHGAAQPDGVVWVGALVVLAGVCSTIATHRAEGTAALGEAREESLRRLARVVEYRDNDTGGHVERMAEYAFLIAAQLGLPKEGCKQLQLASTMHDIGKVAVPDAVLLKPGRLTPEERAIMQTHAQVGHDMLTGSGSELLDLAAEIALTHHERFDGAGYPHGLAGTDIPLPGRIVAVADVFDAVTSKRVYKDAADLHTAVRIVTEGRGTQFDPAVVDAFVGALDAIAAARARHGAPAGPRRFTPGAPDAPQQLVLATS